MELQSKRGNEKFVDEEMGCVFLFDKFSRDGGKKFWRCERRDLPCKARLHTDADNAEILLRLGQHEHDANPVGIEVKRVVTSIRKRAVDTQETTQQVLNVCSTPLSAAAKGQMPHIHAQRKIIQRKRAAETIAPANPATLEGLTFPDEWCQYEVTPGNNVQFLLADSGPSADRVIIFGTRQFCDVLERSQHWFGDGTFKISPPLFHQNIKKKVGEEGLMARYRTDGDFALQVRYISSLAFVPIGDMDRVFAELSELLPPELEPVMSYFEDTYLGRPMLGRDGRRPALFPPAIWSVYERTLVNEPRTNNHAEAAHRRIQCELGLDHPSIWKFIDGLRKVQKGREIFYEGLLRGDNPPAKLMKYRRADERITSIVNDYPNRTTEQYLRGISHNYQMNA